MDNLREDGDHTYDPNETEKQPTFLEPRRVKSKPSATITRPPEIEDEIVIGLTDDEEEVAVSKAQENIWEEVVSREMQRDFGQRRDDVTGENYDTEDEEVNNELSRM